MFLSRQQLSAFLFGPLSKGAAGSLAIRIGSVALAFATSVILARLLGVSQFGAFAFAQAALEFLVVPAMLGMPTLLVREVAQALQKGVGERVRQTVNGGLLLVSSFGALLGLGVFILVQQFQAFIDPELSTPLGAALCILPFLAVLFTWNGAFQGSGRVLAGQLPLYIYRPLIILLLAGAAALLAYPLNALDAVLINLYAAIIAALFAALQWRRTRLPETDNNADAPRFKLLELAKAGIPFALIAGFSTLNSQVDIIMLGLLSGTVDTGLYRVANRLSSLAGFPLLALIVPLSPMLASAFAQQALHGIRNKLIGVTLIAAISALLIGAVLVGFSSAFLGIFGEEFLPADQVLWVLCLLQIVLCFTVIPQVVLSMTGHESALAKVIGLSAIVNIVLNITLIPIMGILGAALATLCAALLLALTSLYTIYRRLDFQSPDESAKQRAYRS